MAKKKYKKGSIEVLAKALRKHGFGVVDIRHNLDEIINNEHTISFKVSKKLKD